MCGFGREIVVWIDRKIEIDALLYDKSRIFWYYLQVMKEQQVEYLDFSRPKRRDFREAPSVRQQMAQLIQKYQTTQPAAKQQIRQPSKPAYQLSLFIELQTHKIEVKVGSCQAQCADAIILPYNTSELFYYPCDCFKEEDFKTDRQKIKVLNSQTNQLYLRSKKLHTYKYRAFVKTQLESAIKDIMVGINSLIKLVIEKKIPLQTIAIFFTSDLYQLQQLIQSLLNLKIEERNPPFTFVLVLPTRKELTSVYSYLE